MRRSSRRYRGRRRGIISERGTAGWESEKERARSRETHEVKIETPRDDDGESKLQLIRISVGPPLPHPPPPFHPVPDPVYFRRDRARFAEVAALRGSHN